MRAGKIDRVKRHLLHEAVSDNFDTIRGLLPRPVRRGRRLANVWLRRAPLLLIPPAGVGYITPCGERATGGEHGDTPAPPAARPRAARAPPPGPGPVSLAFVQAPDSL